ncbi:MAG: hypothetical protein ACX94B_14965 [Henriciella sp.]
MIRATALMIGMMAMAGCQHANDSAVPAVLTEASDETLNALHSQLVTAMDKAGYKLSSTDLTTSSTVTLSPPPLGPNETHSTAMPIQLDLMLEGETCFAMRAGTDQRIELVGITCQAA